jgi:hypothetical protein
MVSVNYRTPLTHYLTINGKYVTPNTNGLFPSSAITGPLSPGTNLTDWKATPSVDELAINLTIQALASGASFAASLLVLDPIEPSNNISFSGNPPLATIPLTPPESPISSAPSTIRLTISRDGTMTIWINGLPTNTLSSQESGSSPYGQVGNFPVPYKWQLNLTVSGGSASIIATFEARQ